MKKNFRLSVIIPAYNEAKTIECVLLSVRNQKIDFVEIEIVVVNDGSTDATSHILKSHPELYDKFVDLEINQGKGGAVRAGILAATGDYILFQDADLEYDPAEYSKLLFPVLQFNADLVMGSRMLAPLYTRVHYFWNKLGNNLITFIFNISFNMTFTDIYSCYLLFRRSLIDPENLLANDFSQQAEILSKCVNRGKVFYEVPISYHGRTVAEGKKIRPHHVFGVLWQIVYWRFRLFVSDRWNESTSLSSLKLFISPPVSNKGTWWKRK